MRATQNGYFERRCERCNEFFDSETSRAALCGDCELEVEEELDIEAADMATLEALYYDYDATDLNAAMKPKR